MHESGFDHLETVTVDQDRATLAMCLAKMRKNHQTQEMVCDALETVADSLPHEIDSQFCLVLARALFPIVKTSQIMEEKQLFPVLLRLDPKNPELAASLERLTFEHWEDESYARDVVDLLLECGRTGETDNAERAGFLMRGFFASMRRHIAFEREHILPMAEQLMGVANDDVPEEAVRH